MGRWSQRHRCGGGVSINFMTQAFVGDIEEVNVVFLTPVTAAAFSLTDFETIPDAFTPTSITQVDPNTLLLDFGEDVSFANSITYVGDVTGILSPTTVTISG